jgi:hypothetical protein
LGRQDAKADEKTWLSGNWLLADTGCADSHSRDQLMWDSKQFKQLVERRFGSQRVEEVGIHIGSAVWKFRLAQYHSSEAKATLRKFLPEGVPNEAYEAVKHILMAAAGTEEARTFREGQFYGEAHLIAFAQSLHSVADIFSHVVYLGLDLETKVRASIPKDKRSLPRITKEMQAVQFAPAVASAIEAMITSPEFRYLRAYVNTTKHQRLLNHPYAVTLVPGAEQHGIEIDAFDYGSEHWPKKWADQFLDETYAALVSHFYLVGNEMNAVLS